MKVTTIMPTMTKTIVGPAKLVLFSGGRMGDSMRDWMRIGPGRWSLGYRTK